MQLSFQLHDCCTIQAVKPRRVRMQYEVIANRTANALQAPSKTTARSQQACVDPFRMETIDDALIRIVLLFGLASCDATTARGTLHCAVDYMISNDMSSDHMFPPDTTTVY